MNTGRVSASQTLLLLTFVTALGLSPGAAASARPAAPAAEGWHWLRGAIASWLLPWLPGASVLPAGVGGDPDGFAALPAGASGDPDGYAALPTGVSGDPNGGATPPVPPPHTLAAPELPPSEH